MKRFIFLSVVAACGLLASISFAQTNDEGLANLQFNFVNPGARSLAMGGAFIGMADDATTALANPAGLVNLVKPEVSVELSSDSFTNEIPWVDGSERELSGGGYAYTFVPDEFPTRETALSFASFVFPVSPHKIVISGFMDEETNFAREFETRGMVILDEAGVPTGDAYFPTSNALSMSVRNVGASVGMQPAEKFSVGVTIAYAKLTLDSQTTRIDRLTGAPANREGLSADSGKLSLGVGARFQIAPSVSAGFVYHKRPKFDAESKVEFSENGGPLAVLLIADQVFKTPDSFGFGLSIRPNESVALNVDVNRVLYSQLLDGYYNVFHPSVPGSTYGKEAYEIADGTELRVGAEYVVLIGERPLAIRGGFWREPFHGMVRKADDAATSAALNDPFFSRTFIEDSNHISFGCGINLDRLALDFAYDYSKDVKRLVVSTVVYF